jgi:Uma2 family endonuclease
MYDPPGPMGANSPQELMRQLMNADEAGVKLEVVQGEYTWEFFPSPLHQGVVADVERSLWLSMSTNPSGCGCFTLADTYIQFADGSVKRPDLMVFCERPPRTREALTVIPEAVIEVLSPRGERKDLQVGPPFYLSQGVKDVVVIDPEGETAHHFRKDGERTVERGTAVRLQCGCELTT